MLRPMRHWNPPERIAEMKAQGGSDELFTTESYMESLTPGEGYVGKCYSNRQAFFIPDVSTSQGYKRKNLAKRFGITSVALKPFANGVLEVGSAKKWESCEWADRVTAEDCQRVAKETGACFCIYWRLDKAKGVLRASAHWNPPERVAAVRASGKNDLYTTESCKSEFVLGEYIVGRACKNKETMFIEDVASVNELEYSRKDLAKQFGIVSVALKPFGDGVYEIGWANKRSNCNWLNTELSSAKTIDGIGEEVSVEELERAAKEAGAIFSIYWGFDESTGMLRAMRHWNPPERIAEMKAQGGSDELFTTESYMESLTPGEGYVGKCYSNKQAFFIPDVSASQGYKRKNLAKRFGITSVALKPFANGVLEVGSAKKWESCEWADRVTVEDCQRVARETGACFCISWRLDKAKGVLRASAHWNPPERVA